MLEANIINQSPELIFSILLIDEKDNLFHQPDDISVTDITNNLEENEILIAPENTPNNSDKSDNSDNVSINSKENNEIVSDDKVMADDDSNNNI